MEDAKKIISDIRENTVQKSASRKDEITIMKAIMNDPSYAVDVYEKEGKVGEYNPGAEFRKVVSNTIASVTHIPGKEAAELMNNYEFNKSDAAAMVGFAKEFVGSYLQTGRKLPLGGRVNSSIELIWKDIPDRTAGIPAKPGGERSEKFIPAHGGIKAINPCPKWVSNSKK